MPLYIVRWPALEVSLIHAEDESQLIDMLDEVGDPGGCRWAVYDGPLWIDLSVPIDVLPTRSDRLPPDASSSEIELEGLDEVSAEGWGYEMIAGEGSAGYEMEKMVTRWAFPAVHAFLRTMYETQQQETPSGSESDSDVEALDILDAIPDREGLEQAVREELDAMTEHDSRAVQVNNHRDLKSRLMGQLGLTIVPPWLDQAIDMAPGDTNVAFGDLETAIEAVGKLLLGDEMSAEDALSGRKAGDVLEGILSGDDAPSEHPALRARGTGKRRQDDDAEARLSGSASAASARSTPLKLVKEEEPDPALDRVFSAIYEQFPEGIIDLLPEPGESTLEEVYPKIKHAFSRIKGALIRYEENAGGDPDWLEDPSGILPGSIEPQKSYHLLFIGPNKKCFSHKVSGEWVDVDTGECTEVEGLGYAGFMVAISLVAPYAMLRMGMLGTYQEGSLGLPGIHESIALWSNSAAPADVEETAYSGSWLKESEMAELETLGYRLNKILMAHGLHVLTESEATQMVPGLRMTDDFTAADWAESRLVSVLDALFYQETI